MVNYFFDSYAVIEFIDGNSMYEKFSNESVTITIFNLAEIYWFALREYGEKKADLIYRDFKPFVKDIDDGTLKDAIRFRIKNKRKKLSYADCIGYVYSLKNDLVFLTGDKEFEKMNNVEFVK